MNLAEEELAFYSEYGRAMGAWADVEQQMYEVAKAFYRDTPARYMLGVGFAGIQGFRSKRMFVEASVNRGLFLIGAKKEIFTDWAELLARLDSKSGERNDLAHYVVTTFESNTEGRRFAL